MVSMSEISDLPIQLEFSAFFKRRLKGLAKKYRQIAIDIQPILDQLLAGNFLGDQIPGTQYTLYKVRAKNSDAQAGKSGGYRLIYRVESPTKVVLHLIYSKSDQATVSIDDIETAIAVYQAEQPED
jgi:mRNA-degrading endonuclease RelE of RelBE toxin-antitoxin system